MYVTSNYGMRLHPILGYYRLHAGIDLRTYCNTPLYAPRDGTVQWSEWRNGFGNQVMLNYGTVNGQSLMSSSNHLTRSVVSSGQQVSRGQLIGYSGNTGLSGACHLHFEVYVGGKTVDPAPLLGLR
jgi:murein DD-endopeptidase MepM/ murein hydrolase activator NlpD